MKTIKEWLSELPEPYRSQALENTAVDTLDENEGNLSMALHEAFDWETSLQGHNYWRILYNLITEDSNKRHTHTVKTVNEEAVIKSNREIAEEIYQISDPQDNNTHLQKEITDEIESILNKYFNR